MPSPRMTTQTLTVLSTILSDPDADWYGLELCKRARLKPGTIYPILDRLLKAEWLERRWEEIDPKVEGRPRRRLYRLTGVGAPAARQALDAHLASLQPAAESWRAAGRPRLV
jgi:PadR family transcriptional regulator PadR